MVEQLFYVFATKASRSIAASPYLKRGLIVKHFLRVRHNQARKQSGAKHFMTG